MNINSYMRPMLLLGVLCSSAIGITSIASAGITPASTTNAPGKDKYTVCHKGHAITIAESAVSAHMAHGDNMGPCGQTQPQTPAQPQTPTDQ